MSTYREEKDSLRKRFPYIINGKFEDGTPVTQERINSILQDAGHSIAQIRDRAFQVLTEELHG